MKKSTVGLVLAAILMVVAGVGFGIAQAGGNHTDGRVHGVADPRTERFFQFLCSGTPEWDRCGLRSRWEPLLRSGAGKGGHGNREFACREQYGFLHSGDRGGFVLLVWGETIRSILRPVETGACIRASLMGCPDFFVSRPHGGAQTRTGFPTTPSQG